MRIISGGQSGVDRAALEAAAALGLDYAGWCPAGGWAEDLPRPPGVLALYPALRPTAGGDPAERTRRNVAESEATLVLVGPGGLAASPGTALTVKVAQALGRPLLIAQAVGAADDAAAWLRQLRPRALNIAGPRESEVPGISAEVRRFLLRLLAPA